MSLANLLAQVDGFALDGPFDPDQIPTRQELKRVLADAPDWTDEELAMIDRLRSMPVRLRQALDDGAKKIKPKGGPPRLIPESEYSKVCDQISEFVRFGMNLGAAKRRVATLRGCSLSLINVIWRTRKHRAAAQ